MVSVLVNSIYLYNDHKNGVLRDLLSELIVISIDIDILKQYIDKEKITLSLPAMI